MFKALSETENKPSYALELSTFLWLLQLAFVCFALIWFIDYFCDILVPFDRIANPLCSGMFLIIYIATKNKWIQEDTAHLFAYCVVAGFLTSSSIYHHMTINGPAFNTAQWLGLNYVLAFLFLDVRRAIAVTSVILVITLAGHFIVVSQVRNLADTFGIVLNMFIAHSIYVILLLTVLKMRIRVALTEDRLKLLEHHSLIDPLTLILNRRGLQNVLVKMEQNHVPFYAMILIDIDHFKTINDQLGHSRGDAVLKDIVATLKALIRSSDELGRWGGEEFLLIATRNSSEEILELAETLRLAVQETVYLDDRTVTISLGVSFSDQAINTDAMFEISDQNLYSAKRQGRNRVVSSQQDTTLLRS